MDPVTFDCIALAVTTIMPVVLILGIAFIAAKYFR